MQDMIGNRIAKGQYLYWKSKEMMVRVLEVAEPSVVGNDTLPVLTVIMQIPVMGVKPGQPAVLSDFMRVVDPAAESRMDAAMVELPSRAQ